MAKLLVMRFSTAPKFCSALLKLYCNRMGQMELPSLKQEPSFIRFDLCKEKIDLDPYVLIANNYGNRKRLILALG